MGLPVPKVFSYAVPPEFAGRLRPGQRVQVPFRGRRRTGVVVLLASADAQGLAPLAGLVDPVPALTAPLLALTRWAAEQTVSAWGEAVMRALPPAAPAAAPATLAEIPPARPGESPRVVWGAARDRLIEADIERTRGQGEAVLLLAPEIEEARGWAERLARRLGEPVALVTSVEPPRQRWATWWAARRGEAPLAVGTRVAAFLPVQPPGLTVVVDEEDPAHKALDVPRWHARELAIQRSRLEGGSCLLGTAAPSLETWARVEAGDARAEEASGAGWPAVERIDLRGIAMPTSLSSALRRSVGEALGGGHAVLLVLNRVGYGRSLSCAECGAARRCPRCRLALTYHRGARALTCRLCGTRAPAASLCSRCRGRRLVPLGWGTERLESDARAAFPGVRVARYDGTLDPASAARIREAFRRREVQILVGTQMAVRLAAARPVGLGALVLADTTLNRPDFRAAERTFQLAWRLAEAVGPGGRLSIQSYHPHHAALDAVAAGARGTFYRTEHAERQELGYPPAGRLAHLLAVGRAASRLADDLAARCRAAGLTVLGPAALAGDRVQLVTLGGAELPLALGSVLEPLRGRRRFGSVRLAVDVDPVELP